MDLLVSKHSAIQAPQASEEKNFTSLSTAERGKIHTVDTSTPLMAKLDLSSLACAASMICFTVSGSSVCAFRPCYHHNRPRAPATVSGDEAQIQRSEKQAGDWAGLGPTLETPPPLSGTAVDCEGMNPPPPKRELAFAAPPPSPP